MSEIAQKYLDKLPMIKENIEEAYEYFRENFDRFHDYRKFVFKSSMSDADIAVNKELQRPTIEANICEAYLSRQRGEFSKQEPSLYVSPADDVMGSLEPKLPELLEGHIRSIFFDAKKDDLEFDTYTDTESGGFSVLQVRTAYLHSMSFDQKIVLDRVFDPTLCGFDPLARESHKGDGKYCFSMAPMKKKEFLDRYDDKYLTDTKFVRNIEGFNWSYKNGDDDVVLVCDYYEKKKIRKQIVKLINGKVMTMKEYKDFVDKWNSSGHIEVAPGIIGKPRYTDVETICRYRLIENNILEYVETDYKYFPLVFVDGNSVMLRDSTNGAAYQMTRPYIYHMRGIQKLKNLTLQILANELENIPNGNKLFIAEESLIPTQLEAITNPQKASSIIYKSRGVGNSEIPPPQPVPRQPAPPEIINALEICDKTGQVILGSYDASLGINDNQLSGVAIQEGATQSNAAAMPYIVNFMKALNRVGEIIIDLIPKYYVGERTIPISQSDGDRQYTKINNRGGISLDYDPNTLRIKVEAGVNYTVQKNHDLQMIEGLMKASPLFSKFMNEEGLPMLLNNFEIKGIDQLKKVAKEWTEKMKSSAKNQPPPPEMLKIQVQMKKLEQDLQKMQQEYQVKTTALSIDKQNADTDRIKALADIGVTTDKLTLEKDKVEAEDSRTATESLLKTADMKHQHAMDILNHHQENMKIDSKQSKNI